MAHRRTIAAVALGVLAVGVVVWIATRHHFEAPSPTDRAGDLGRSGSAADSPPKPLTLEGRPRSTQGPTSPPGTPLPKDALAPGTTGVAIEVVGEDGVRCAEGTVAFKASSIQLMERGMTPLKYLRDASLAAGNPVLLRDLPDDADGLDVAATARGTGLATATAHFTVHLHRTESVRLVLPRGRSVHVRVTEADGGTPVEGASVVSVTETERRGLEAQALRGKSGPGSAVTDARGSCEVGDLGAGEHEFEVDALGHLRVKAKWTEGPLAVRLPRVRGTGTVSVTVTGPDGKPAVGVVVTLMETDRTATTGPYGVATFEDVPAGPCFFRFDIPTGPGFDRWVERVQAGLNLLAEVVVEPGGRHAVELGMRRSEASFEARLVAEDGAPVAGVSVSLSADLAILKATSDAAGLVRIPDLAPSTLTAFVEVGPRADWTFGDIEVKVGERVSRTWTLGSATLAGRILKAGTKAPVAGAHVSVAGPLSGLATTDADGRFLLPRARAGTYRVSVFPDSVGGLGARPVDVVVPSVEEAVIELRALGGIAVRFAASDRAALREATLTVKGEGDEVLSLHDPKVGDADLVAADVIPGPYTITVELGGRRRTYSVVVKGGAATVVEVGVP